MKRNAGFTLIELLVSISIFVMILSIAAVSYVQANRRARDGRRQADLEQVRTALEIYRVDLDTYPITSVYTDMINTLRAAPTYINTSPADPRPPRAYFYSSAGATYTLCADMEGTGFTSPCTVGGTCCGAACDYCTCNP